MEPRLNYYFRFPFKRPTVHTLLRRMSRRRCEMYCGARLCVCLSVRGRMPTLLHAPDVTWGVVGMLPSCAACALLGGFAIGERVALLWQYNANAKC